MSPPTSGFMDGEAGSMKGMLCSRDCGGSVCSVVEGWWGSGRVDECSWEISAGVDMPEFARVVSRARVGLSAGAGGEWENGGVDSVGGVSGPDVL